MEDYELWLDLANAHKKLYNLDILGVYHRLHDQSYFNGSEQQKNDLDKLMKDWTQKK